MESSYSEKTVVITGASSGIARATALGLARMGASVVLASRQQEALHELAVECERMGARAMAVQTDVTDEAQVKNLAAKAVEKFGKIDVWVNAAAVTLLARFDEAPSDAFRRVLETNFFGYVHGARAVLPHFRERKAGVLINVSSVVGKVPTPYASAYVASKFAVTGFTESLRMEYQSTPGIHVCSVFPATTDTPFFQKAANYTGRAVQAMPPVYSPESVAAAIIHCIEKPRREIFLGNAQRMVAMRTIAPALAEKVAASKMDRKHFQDKPAAPTKGNIFEPMPEFSTVHGGWGSSPEAMKSNLMMVGTVLAAAGVVAYLLARPRPQTGIRRYLPRKYRRKSNLLASLARQAYAWAT